MGSFVRERREAILMLSAARRGVRVRVRWILAHESHEHVHDRHRHHDHRRNGHDQRDVLGLAERDASGPFRRCRT